MWVEYIDNGGTLYNALEWIEAKHRHETFRLRNMVEHAFRSLKRRMKRFNHLKRESITYSACNYGAMTV